MVQERDNQHVLCRMSSHLTLDVWHRARHLALSLHRAFPHGRSHLSPGLRGQLLPACASIAANIAEGASQPTNAQYARFLGIAIASASETESHLTLAIDLGVIVNAEFDFQDETTQIRRMLYGLKSTVENRPDRPKRTRSHRAPN